MKIPFDINKIERIEITQGMISVATEKDPHRPYNANSFLAGEGNFIGLLGEEMVKSKRPDFISESTYDYDMIFRNSRGDIKIDVKTKYQSSLRILPYVGTWMASVCENSVHQQTDGYIFCRICKLKDGDGFRYPFGWIAGKMSKKEFFDKAKFYPKGTPEGDNGYLVKEPCYSLPYNQLYQVEGVI